MYMYICLCNAQFAKATFAIFSSLIFFKSNIYILSYCNFILMNENGGNTLFEGVIVTRYMYLLL